MREVLLGIDIGTSFCKAVVIDTDGVELALGRARTPWTIVPTGAEADPGALVRAALAAATEAVAGVQDAEVVAVGLAGMAETGVLVDRAGTPACPAIAWHDARGADEAAAFAAALGAEEFAARTGLPASRLCTLGKLRWQRTRIPAVRRAVRWLGVPEWVGRALGAGDVAELSLASRTGMLSLDDAAWWPEALSWLGLGEALTAEPVAAGTNVGRVGAALPSARGAVITIAGHDHLVAMVGAGATSEGDVLHSVGTADVFVRTVDAHLDRAQVAAAVAASVTVGWHVLPGRWAMLSGGEHDVTLTAVLRRLGVDGQAARDALTEAAARIGLGEGTTPAHVWRDALAAGAEQSAASLARSDAVGGRRRRIVATGGGARGSAARAAKETRLGPIEWSPVQEATARGAALLAGVAAGIYASAADTPGVPAAVSS